MKKLTHEEFLKRLPKDRNYEIIGEYVGMNIPILLNSKFGECLITPNCLIQGTVICIHSSINKTSFCINKFKEVHNSTYDYSKFIYNGATIKSIITCSVHGDFEQSSNVHLKGSGCPKCGKIVSSVNNTSNKSTFLSKLPKINFKCYNYDKFEYKGSLTKSTIICKIHGDFEQLPSSHLQGNGCPKCALKTTGGYKKEDFIRRAKSKICTFYILKCWSESEKFYKIGITSNCVKNRYSSKRNMPYEYEIIKEIRGEAGEIWDLELKNKKLLHLSSYKPKKDFKGSSTECFLNVNLLLKRPKKI